MNNKVISFQQKENYILHRSRTSSWTIRNRAHYELGRTINQQLIPYRFLSKYLDKGMW